MGEERQALADAPLRERGFTRAPRAWARYYLRKAAYGVAALRKMVDRPAQGTHDSPKKTASYWDHKLSTTAASTYLGGTIEIDWRNALTATLIKYHANACPSVLDIGCAGGTLALTLPPFKKYLGIDASSYAIKLANEDPEFRRQSGVIAFIAADIRYFQLTEQWDVIVFNEVLYYLSVEEAVRQVGRYAKALKPGGILCFSMSDDPKSHAIYGELARNYEWRGGALWQRKALRPDYRTRINRERTAFLVAAIQPHEEIR